MIVIPKDLFGDDYPEDVAELITQLKLNYVDEQDLDDYYDDSVIVGCDCGCGGDSFFDSWNELREDRREILSSLKELGYVVEGEDYDDGTDGAEPEG